MKAESKGDHHEEVARDGHNGRIGAISIITPVVAEDLLNQDTDALPVNISRTERTPVFTDDMSLNEALNVPGGTLDFTTDDPYPWVADGEAAVTTNQGVNNSSSTLYFTVQASEGNNLEFDYRTSTETKWDKLIVRIDGDVVNGNNGYSGLSEWTKASFSLTPGEHNITFTYTKDSTTIGGSDSCWLDNVYVGKPAEPESVEIQSMATVAVGRNEQLTWTVLPEDAFDKSVTFASSDTSVVTVNENGMITGVSIGLATITVTTVVGGHSAICPVMVTEAPEETIFTGYILNNPGGTEGAWGSFSDRDPGQIKNLVEMSSTYAAEIVGPYGYGFLDNNNGGRYYIINMETMEISYPVENSSDVVVIDMSYDYSTQTMYAIGNNLMGNRSLYTVELTTGELTEVAEIYADGRSVLTLGISSDGVAYSITYANGITSKLYTIDLQTGVGTLIGDTGLPAKGYQSMSFDHDDNQLFWAQYADASSNGLYIVNVETATVSRCGTIGNGAQVCGLIIPNETFGVAPIETGARVTFIDDLTGEFMGGIEVDPGTVLEDYHFPTPPEHEGYVFAYWDYAGRPISEDTMIFAVYRDLNNTTATIILTANNVWGDDTGYQMLIDADATAFGTIILEEAPFTLSGDAPDGVYEEFEYTIPRNADGALTTRNVVVDNTVTIEIPAGIYDWCITNPVPGDCIWIVGEGGNVEGRADDYTFMAGYTYHFTVSFTGEGDCVNVETTAPIFTDEPIIIIPSLPEIPVPPIKPVTPGTPIVASQPVGDEDVDLGEKTIVEEPQCGQTRLR